MIEKLSLYVGTGLDPYENLAIEYQLLTTTPVNCCTLYLWQNRNTVVIGKNQNAWAECRVSLLEAEGGKLARRLSGGGAVYHDTGNLNFTFLCHQEDYDLDRQFEVIARACAYAGIPVERSGRNDLLAQGRKFSGNAFYHAQGRAYHHGTILVHADKEKLSRYLSPPRAKLEAKGVSSVRSRVCNLSEFVPDLTCDTMKTHMAKAFEAVYGLSATSISLSDGDRTQIRQKAREFSQWEHLFGQKLPCSFSCEQYFVWGTVCLEMNVTAGTVTQVRLYTDAMDWTLPSQVEAALTGCRFQPEALKSALDQLEDLQVRQDLCRLLEQAF